MENINYLIIISINFGENFPLNDIIQHFGQQTTTSAIIEARFNDSVLTSDAIEITTTSVDLKTELCFQMDRKQLHDFRIERKPIKLQAFLVDSNSMDRHFVGYTVLDLRNAKNFSNKPKYEWKTLLNPKYKGSSSRRPQMSIALMLNKLEDNQTDDNLMDKSVMSDSESISSQISEPSVSGFGNIRISGRDLEANDQSLGPEVSEIENDINVRFKDSFHHIWDTKQFSEKDCKLKFTFSVTIAFADNLNKLFISPEQIQNSKPFHFRYSFLGTTVQTKPFSDINSCDLEIERMAFNILTTDRNTLSVYFDLHQTIEIQFCDNFDVLFGFVAISLSKFSERKQSIFKPIEGSFMLLPDNETIDICEPYPIVGVSIELRSDNSIDSQKVGKTNPLKTSSAKGTKDENHMNKESNETNLNHYCFAIDLRNIRVIDSDIPQINSCYLRFFYAFFGFTDSIKTFPSIPLKANEEIVIPHGFCAFNFATTEQKLEKTLKEIPLIIEMIEESMIDTIIGTASVDLSQVLSVTPNRADAKQAVNLYVSVIDEMQKSFAEIQIIMFLQNYGKTKIPITPNMPEISVMKGSDTIGGDSVENINNLDELLVETALEIELWKEKQLILFREQMKQKETQTLKKFEEKQFQREEEMKTKLKELSELESKLLKSLEELKVRENNIIVKESEIESKQREVEERYSKLNEEISGVMTELKDNFEQKLSTEKNRFKAVEYEKSKLQERIYSLERKVKEKENKIKELEDRVTEITNKSVNAKNNSKVNSKDVKTPSVKTITRNTNPTINRNVSVIREPSVSSRPNTAKTPTKSPIFPQRTATSLKTNIKTVSNNSMKSTLNKSTNNSRIRTPEDIKRIQLIETIKLKRKQLIDRGLPLTDPLIREIDSQLKSV